MRLDEGTYHSRDEISSFLVDGGDLSAALYDVRPLFRSPQISAADKKSKEEADLGSTMPVKLANRAGFQPHVDAGHGYNLIFKNGVLDKLTARS